MFSAPILKLFKAEVSNKIFWQLSEAGATCINDVATPGASQDRVGLGLCSPDLGAVANLFSN